MTDENGEFDAEETIDEAMEEFEEESDGSEGYEDALKLDGADAEEESEDEPEDETEKVKVVGRKKK